MFDSVRVALLATLSVGAAVVANPNIAYSKVDRPVEAIVPALPSSALPDAAAAQSSDLAIPDSDDATPPSAKSLTQLVAGFSQVGAADDEQKCLAGAVYFEAKGEPLEGQLAVARTIMNRAASGRFADSFCGVIRQRGQFSFVGHSGLIPAFHREAKAWRTAIAVARIAIDDLWTAPVRDALYFHAKHVTPGWRMVRVASVGNQVFYR